MMGSAIDIVIGAISIALGCAYVGLGVVAVLEMIDGRRSYGVSRFGLGYVLMAISCGPHHLLHGSHVFRGEDVSGPIAVATLMALPFGAIFVGLRIERMLGGRGDRTLQGNPVWLHLLPIVGLAVTGGLIVESARGLTMAELSSASSLSNLFVAVTYAMVGWPLFRTQVRQRRSTGSWSLAGIGLAGIFPTCAVTHLVYALDATSDVHVLVFDLIGVPASVYFLVVVVALHRESLVDWNARPVVGERLSAPRSAPWESLAPSPRRQIRPTPESHPQNETLERIGTP